MSSKRDIIKILIEVSPTAEKADKIIEIYKNKKGEK